MGMKEHTYYGDIVIDNSGIHIRRDADAKCLILSSILITSESQNEGQKG